MSAAVVVVLDGVEGGSLTTSALAVLVSDALVRASVVVVVVGSIPDGVGVVVRGSTCAGGIEGEWRLPSMSTVKETLPPISARGGGWQRWENRASLLLYNPGTCYPIHTHSANPLRPRWCRRRR